MQIRGGSREAAPSVGFPGSPIKINIDNSIITTMGLLLDSDPQQNKKERRTN
jgi:hypothetical protein